MRARWVAVLAAVLILGIPSPAYALGATIPEVVLTCSGIVALVVAALLLVEMLALRKLAQGAAIADNITYAILAVVCLAASVLAGWVSRFVPTGFTAEQARLGADLLSVAAMVLFGIYFFRVWRAMSRFLGLLTGEEQNLISVIDVDAAIANEDGPVG
jgi:hypothetical protein